MINKTEIATTTERPDNRHIIGAAIFYLFLVLILLASNNVHALPNNNRDNLSNTLSQWGIAQAFYSDASEAFDNGNIEDAVRLYTVAATRGHAAANYELGNIYYNGLGTSTDFVKAISHYKVAANFGHAQAQYNIGVAYAQGLIYEKDLTAAITWWRRSALSGNIDAQYNLGLIYSRGNGVKADTSEAVSWWRMAAAQGDAAAQFNLGVMLANGEGVSRNMSAAIKWWKLSAQQGFQKAIYALKTVDNVNLSQNSTAAE